jgi:hypothetical protein
VSARAVVRVALCAARARADESGVVGDSCDAPVSVALDVFVTTSLARSLELA